MRENARNVVGGLFSSSNNTARPSQKEMEEQARKAAPVLGESYESILERIKNYWASHGKEVVLVYKFGDGPKDFDVDPDYADVLSPDGEARKAFAWKDPETGKLTLAKPDELKAFRAENPDFEFPTT